MKARVRASGKIVEVTRNMTNGVYATSDGKCYWDVDLDFNLDPPQLEVTISGWVARDQPNSISKKGSLHVFHHKPSRDYFDDNDVICGFWDEDDSPAIPLSESTFPNLTWQDEPLEVEITIKPKKQ